MRRYIVGGNGSTRHTLKICKVFSNRRRLGEATVRLQYFILYFLFSFLNCSQEKQDDEKAINFCFSPCFSSLEQKQNSNLDGI